MAEGGAEMNVEKTQIQHRDGTPLAGNYFMFCLTYRCTAECSHCFAASSTRKGEPVELGDIREYLVQAQEAGFPRVWFFGGEPFLYFDLLASGIEEARRLGLESTTTSNAFWATSEKVALKRLHPLKERGLHDISFSADPFHCEYVPLEHVRNAIAAAISLDIFDKSGGVGTRYFIEKHGNDVLGGSREIQVRLLPHAVDAGEITFVGTAAEVLSERPPKQSWEKYRTCGMERSVFRGWEGATVDSCGHVCPGNCPLGISVGNLKETRLSELITTYDPQAHPIFKTVYEQGPVGVAKMAMAHGFKPTKYANACHLCYEARKVLLNHYPEHLAPAIYYERAK